MLGTWSLGDYEGSRSLDWAHRLLTEGLGVDPGLLHATVYGGGEQVGPDTESLRLWQERGVPVERTVDDNWWSNGPVGPCGPRRRPSRTAAGTAGRRKDAVRDAVGHGSKTELAKAGSWCEVRRETGTRQGAAGR